MAIDPDIQLPRGVNTFNEAFFDGLIRHQIGLLRLSGSIRNEVLLLLDATEQDMVANIERILRSHRGFDSPRSVQRMNTLIRIIRGSRGKVWDDINADWVRAGIELSKAEPNFTNNIFKMAVPVIIETTIPSVALLTSLATSRPFEGRVLREWASKMKADDLRRIENAVKIGMVQGDSSAAIARRVVGTRAQRGTNGVTQATRREVDAVTRTMVNAMSNEARRAYYVENIDIFPKEQYVATLDSRTTPICRSLDGKIFDTGDGPHPPLHFMCRSLRIAVIDGTVVGDRPARGFTERGLLREFTKQSDIPTVTTRGSLPRGTKGKFDKFSRKRMRELTGTTPAKVTYGQWLDRQSATFQDDVLGKTRGILFRRGDLTLDRFVNRAGDQIPLRDLARRSRDAFIKAGLNPEDF